MSTLYAEPIHSMREGERQQPTGIKRLLRLLGLAAAVAVVSSVLIAGNAQSATAASCKDYVYRQSSSYSSCIKNIQVILNASAVSPTTCNGYREQSSTITADGVIGPVTAARIKNFQRSHCLTADGIVGANTWSKLCEQARQDGYLLSGPGWYDRNDPKDRIGLASYKAGVASGCGNSWPKLLNY